MPYRSEDPRQLIIGRYADWVKRFSVDDYFQNRPMIEKLHEEKQLALVSTVQLERRLGSVQNEVDGLRLENRTLRHQLDEASRNSAFMFSLSLLAIVLLGLGVNLATGRPGEWFGWALIACGCTLEVIAFFLRPRRRDG